MPRHIRNILIAAFLAILALLAGINGYVHHQFKTNIDNALSAVQIFAQVKYSDISTSILSGEVKLENVRVNSAVLPEEITLGNIVFETPGFLYMLNGPDNIKKGVMPAHLGLALDDFYLDLNGETAEWLDRLVKRLQPLYSEDRKICGGKTLFGPSDYKEMGYTRLLSNMRMAYDFKEHNKTLTLNITSETRNMGSIDAIVTITNLSSMDSANVLQGGMPQLSQVEVNYQDKTYVPRIVKYCSELDKTKKEVFIEAEVKQSDEHFYKVWGFAPGAGLREAYKDFLLKPDLVTLSMEPSKEFNPMLVQSMSTEEVMEALNLRLKINGLLVTDLSFKMPPAEFIERFEQRMATSLDFNALLQGEPVKPPESIEKAKPAVVKVTAYHKISLAQAPQHISDFVRITTKNGNLRKGQLMSMDKVNLYVQQKVSGGKFTMTVPREKIKTIEAYYSK